MRMCWESRVFTAPVAAAAERLAYVIRVSIPRSQRSNSGVKRGRKQSHKDDQFMAFGNQHEREHSQR